MERPVSVPDVIAAPRTDPIYNCHPYLTKVPISGIAPLIEAFTKPGDVVVDMFAGSGMTGIAAAMLGREARLSDISVLGRHIALGYLTQVSPSEFRRAADEAVAAARANLGSLYLTRRISDGSTVEMSRTIWSFCYACPTCSSRLVYFECLGPNGAQPTACPSCGARFSRRSWRREQDVPVRVAVWSEDGKLCEQKVQDSDVAAIGKAASDQRQRFVPSAAIGKHREMYRRSALEKHGLTETKLFFSARNSLALLELWKAIEQVGDAALRQKLRFAFTAMLPRASRRYQWGPKRPLNAQNQTYYIAPVYYEWNVFELFARKVDAALRADTAIFGSTPLLRRNVAAKVDYRLTAADSLRHLEDKSADYVFTDPPFGSNIFYSDMNLFQEAWLGELTDNSCEAVVHTSGKKKNGAAERYEKLLRGAFKEAYRVLKASGHLSVVFGNSNGVVWNLVLRALRDAGFESVPIHLAILDKRQRSVKGLNSGSESVVTVDLVLTVSKAGGGAAKPVRRQADAAALLTAAVERLNTEERRNPSYVYAATVREAIRRGQLIDHLHFADVLIALRNSGYAIDAKSGLLDRPVAPSSLSA